jgi:hypothetical protein
MELRNAENTATRLMTEHGLVGWRFEWDSSRRRFGQCSYGPKIISLSRHLVLANHEARVTNTILHEIAHALLPVGVHHGPAWVRKAKAIGCDGLRCYDSGQTIPLVHAWLPYTGTCPGCKKTHGKTRVPRRPIACTACCRAHNRGRYDERFNLVWTVTPRFVPPPFVQPVPMDTGRLMVPVHIGLPPAPPTPEAVKPTRYALWKARKLAKAEADRAISAYTHDAIEGTL